jgi:enoyl-CoA hydratase/carnithine racemase
MSNELNIEYHGDATIVRFSRSEIRNPLSIPVLDKLHKIADNCRLNTDIDCLIFTGTADVFASGADLREIASVTPDSAAEFAHRGQSLMTKIASLPQMTIAAINGYCFGGALDLGLRLRTFRGPRLFSSRHRTWNYHGMGRTAAVAAAIGQANAMECFYSRSDRCG